MKAGLNRSKCGPHHTGPSPIDDESCISKDDRTTYYDLPLLVDQALAQLPEVYFALGHFNTWLRALDQVIEYIQDRGDRVNVWVIRCRMLQCILKLKFQARKPRNRTRQQRGQVSSEQAGVLVALLEEVLVL